MDNFKDLLKIYSQKFNSSQLLIDEIITVINEVTSLKINKKSFKIKDNIGFLELKPKEKLLILLYKEKLLDKLKEGDFKIIDLK